MSVHAAGLAGSNVAGMHQQDVEELVEQVAVKLGRGLSLEDLDGVLLAYSSNQSHADRVRVNFLLSKRVPADVKAWQLSHGIATAVRPVVVPANEELGMLGRVCVPLLVRGFRVGYLWVQQDIEDQSATAILTQLPGVRDERAAVRAAARVEHCGIRIPAPQGTGVPERLPR